MNILGILQYTYDGNIVSCILVKYGNKVVRVYISDISKIYLEYDSYITKHGYSLNPNAVHIGDLISYHVRCSNVYVVIKYVSS